MIIRTCERQIRLIQKFEIDEISTIVVILTESLVFYAVE